jgi:FtsZ-interacting cell division protein ZipA
MGVVLFNWMQQRRYRRGAEQAFGSRHEDVLLKTGATADDNGRIEPQLGKEILQDPAMPDAVPPEPPPLVPPDAVEVSPPDSKASPMPAAAPVAPAATVARAASTARAAPTARAASTARAAPTARVAPTARAAPAAPVAPVAPAPLKFQENKNAEIVDYVVSINGDQPISGHSLAELLQRKMDFGRPLRWLGQREADAGWEEITAESNARESKGYHSLKGRLKLVDRTGPISEVSLSEFRDMAESFAQRINASAACPDIHEAYIQAVSLDEFCTEVDVMIGINIISRDAAVFTGTKIRMLAEAAGLKLGTEGVFDYYDESGLPLFSLGNFESSVFLPASIRTLTTRGVTFLLDVPKVANGEAVFAQMVHLANTFADDLGGVLVDDNGFQLNDSGIAKIRQQLSAIQTMMTARGIPAGSETALRLFA